MNRLKQSTLIDLIGLNQKYSSVDYPKTEIVSDNQSSRLEVQIFSIIRKIWIEFTGDTQVFQIFQVEGGGGGRKEWYTPPAFRGSVRLRRTGTFIGLCLLSHFLSCFLSSYPFPLLTTDVHSLFQEVDTSNITEYIRELWLYDKILSMIYYDIYKHTPVYYTFLFMSFFVLYSIIKNIYTLKNKQTNKNGLPGTPLY